MSAINAFLLKNNLHIAQNPCVSPDFCLDWDGLRHDLQANRATEYPKSRFTTAVGDWTLFVNLHGDHAWKVHAADAGTDLLMNGAVLNDGSTVFPATWDNLIRLKNLIQEHDHSSTIFPTAAQKLGQSTLGIGARFTALHWPAVDWAMSALELGLTANQNSIPRELVYDVDEMLANRLDSVPFPFIGTNVPEGHQGQSVEGMSHGCVLAKLKSGFHHRRVAWSFNADHQPIGGKFDAREDQLVTGCVLASYITFDLSPELALNTPAQLSQIPENIVSQVRTRVGAAGLTLNEADFNALLVKVWPSLQKMKRRDEKYAAARTKRFTTTVGRAYLRELSIDELPGLTTPETTAIMLALCEALEMKINFVAPAFGFQKNMPYPDNHALRALIQKQWNVCEKFGVSIGFHSGSGKSAENYQIMGEVTGGRLEIKTSGRYTYEMGRALFASQNAADQALWRDWHTFTLELALKGAFSTDATEQKMARTFITTAITDSRSRGNTAAPGAADADNVFSSPATTRAALAALTPSPDDMFWFEYNFLYVLAADGRPEKAALGDHSPAGYRQRARFYSISDEGRLLYSKNVASYIVFLAENTGLATSERCSAARKLLERYATLDQMLGDVSR